MTDNVKFTIDGISISAGKTDTVLEAALENGIYIPHLCYHPDLDPAGVCRLCVVEIEGRRGLSISCKTPVEAGMTVNTDTPEVRKVRKVSTALLVKNHHENCNSCSKNTDCELQKIAGYVGITQHEQDSMRER